MTMLSKRVQGTFICWIFESFETIANITNPSQKSQMSPIRVHGLLIQNMHVRIF